MWVRAGLALLLAGLIAAVLVSGPLAGRSAAAAPTAVLHETPTSGGTSAGATVTVSVAMTVSGDSVNAVEADVTYAVSQMKFVSAKVDTTVWGITASKSGAAGKVRIGVGSTTPRTGTVQIATVTFTALKTGSYRFGIGQTSSVISATTNTELLNHTGAKSAPPTDQGPFPLSSVPDCLTAAPNTGGAHICKVRAAGGIASWQALTGEWIVIRAAAGENTLADCSADQASIVPTSPVMESQGIARSRVEMVGPCDFPQYLEKHNQSILMLDTYPFNGHTTTCHGLWMGVPIVTLVGQSHASRMGLSVLKNLGLEELAAQSPRSSWR